MGESSFTIWISREVTTARCALLKIYEADDRMRMIEGPQLEREYMEKVGSFEETVIAEEMECEILQKKKELIQTAINRREPVDEAAIDAELAAFRAELMKEASGEGGGAAGSSGDGVFTEELQDLYRRIVKDFHPQMHPELTEAQKLLFQKAQEAYRRKDGEALKLIYDMLTNREEDGAFTFSMLSSIQLSLEVQDRMAQDYALAGKLYPHFQPTEEEVSMEEDLARHRQATKEIMEKMEQQRQEFPFSAAEMLADPERVEAYRKELELRLQNAKKERQQRTAEIERMLAKERRHE